MNKLTERVEKELGSIAEKGLTSSNLDTAYKLIDIYKDIKESKYYQSEVEEKNFGGDYDMSQRRDSRGRYMGNRYSEYNRYDREDYDRSGYWEANGRYGNYPYLDERSRRYLDRMMEGIDSYNEGKDRYRHGEKEDRMLDGIEKAMSAVCMFVESIADFAETTEEKEIIRNHINKMKKI